MTFGRPVLLKFQDENSCRSQSFEADFKPPSVTKNVVGLQTDDADHVGQNSSAHVARVVGLQTDAVVVTETRFTFAREIAKKTILSQSVLFLACM